MRQYFPTHAGDPVFEHWHVNHERLAASPGAAAWFMRMLMETDIREVLPAISVPTLVLHHPKYRDGCAALAEKIPNAEMVEIDAPDISTYADARIPEEGSASWPRQGGQRTGARAHHRPLHGHRRIDLARVGHGRQALARAARGSPRNGAGADRPLRRQGDPRHGDGFFATFEGPARAIACARAAIASVGDLGLDLRSGVHTGEVELVGSRVEGIAVHIGARVAAEARPLRGARVEHRPRPRRRLGDRLRGSRRARPEGGARQVEAVRGSTQRARPNRVGP